MISVEGLKVEFGVKPLFHCGFSSSTTATVAWWVEWCRKIYYSKILLRFAETY